MTNKKALWFALALLAMSALIFAPAIPGLQHSAQIALAITVFAALMWATAPIPSGFTGLMVAVSFVIFKVASPQVVFSLWSLPLGWFTFSALMMALAVEESGLARRVALYLSTRYAKSFVSIIIMIFCLHLVLGLIIPQPFPRCLVIMAVMDILIEKAALSKKDATSVGFCVFASSPTVSSIFLSYDVLLNPATSTFAGQPISWLVWAKHMGIPGVVASLINLGMFLLVFRSAKQFNMDTSTLHGETVKLGKVSLREWKAIFWMAAALVLWMTQSLHGVDPAWIALGIVVGMSLPIVGDLLTTEHFLRANWSILLFLTGAVAIGAVSKETGLAQWLAGILLPESAPANPYCFAALISLATMGIHMLVGSALTTMATVMPPIMAYAQTLGWDPLFPALVVYITVNYHYVLPFHHATILVGTGNVGRFTQTETLKYAIPLTILTLFCATLVGVSWWKFTGLIHP